MSAGDSPPPTREDLFEAIADAIGWGATADDVASITKKIEAQGVRFILAEPDDNMRDALDKAFETASSPFETVGPIMAVIAANPYAPGKP
jgi:hypothetical protein